MAFRVTTAGSQNRHIGGVHYQALTEANLWTLRPLSLRLDMREVSLFLRLAHLGQ